ncbi:unnamed protein product [Sphenostylis stenocarpa]|uniref:Uncharacterized protein n=1 Tax=Sphenostylis stenocarpa TaxID=92480 RepID=A0AA86VUW3_9FABA|nr:unnamed protein product [Sphenostylis stenocarpa]
MHRNASVHNFVFFNCIFIQNTVMHDDDPSGAKTISALLLVTFHGEEKLSMLCQKSCMYYQCTEFNALLCLGIAVFVLYSRLKSKGFLCQEMAFEM